MNDQTFETISACFNVACGLGMIGLGFKEGRWSFGIIGIGFLVANIPDLVLEGAARHFIGFGGLLIIAGGIYLAWKRPKQLDGKPA